MTLLKGSAQASNLDGAVNSDFSDSEPGPTQDCPGSGPKLGSLKPGKAAKKKKRKRPQPGLRGIINHVNPSNSVLNCGNIVDAAIGRFRGRAPRATAPAAQDGTFNAIAARNHTNIAWGHTFNDAFNAVRAGGNGTVAIVGVQYSGGRGSHVITMVNRNGTPTILEAQNWGAGFPRELITSGARANARYNSDGGSNIGYGIVP